MKPATISCKLQVARSLKREGRTAVAVAPPLARRVFGHANGLPPIYSDNPQHVTSLGRGHLVLDASRAHRVDDLLEPVVGSQVTDVIQALVLVLPLLAFQKSHH